MLAGFIRNQNGADYTEAEGEAATLDRYFQALIEHSPRELMSRPSLGDR